MKRILLFIYFTILSSFSGMLFSQTYQLTGNPIVTTGWTTVSSGTAIEDYIRLTQDIGNQYGAIKLDDPINLKYCDKWKVEFDFRIDGNGTTQFGRGDGFTFWYLTNPPTGFVSGGGLGIPANADGLMVAFDIFNNFTEGQMSQVHVLYGTNNMPAGNPNVEFNNTAGSTYHSEDLNSTIPFVGATYKHVEVNGETSATNPNNWVITVRIDGTLIVTQTFSPSGGAIGMGEGYFGFSAATGGASARHSIKNAKIFIDKVPILNNTITPFVCLNPSTGNGTIDLTAYQDQFVTNPANYQFTYSANGTIITNPTAFQYSGAVTVNVIVKDPSSTLCDNGDGKIILNPTPFEATDSTLIGCNNNGEGTSIFDLTTAAVTNIQGAIKQFYPTMIDLNNGSNEITNPSNYLAPAGTVYVKVTTPQGCFDTAKITLNLYPVVQVINNFVLKSCFIATQPTTGSFDLTNAAVTSQEGTTKTYYPSFTDAVNGTNAISAPQTYIAPSGVIYIKVTNARGCYSIAKVTLEVLPPLRSDILKDKTICMEERTTLDAGSGFTAYEWSTGATTSSISNVSVGTYWVKLTNGECVTLQNVNVFATEQPVISSVDISSTTITIHVTGGTPPYQYSLDNIIWQTSNIFQKVPRGDNKVYVKDAYNCNPMDIIITVPNLINVITPNGDGVNDAIDYSALSNKKNLTFNVFDRYGTKIYQGDRSTNYRWDGTISGRKTHTGSYWYTIKWNENDKKNTASTYSGWILVKNRE